MAYELVSRNESLPEGCSISEHGFSVSYDVTPEQSKKILYFINRSYNGTMCGYGAWWNAGDFDHGERKAMIEAEEHDGPNYSTIKDAGWVYGRVAPLFPLCSAKVAPRDFWKRYSVLKDIAGIRDEEKRLEMLNWAFEDFKSRDLVREKVKEITDQEDAIRKIEQDRKRQEKAAEEERKRKEQEQVDAAAATKEIESVPTAATKEITSSETITQTPVEPSAATSAEASASHGGQAPVSQASVPREIEIKETLVSATESPTVTSSLNETSSPGAILDQEKQAYPGSQAHSEPEVTRLRHLLVNAYKERNELRSNYDNLTNCYERLFKRVGLDQPGAILPDGIISPLNVRQANFSKDKAKMREPPHMKGTTAYDTVGAFER
jgi:hypothetical protein